MPPLKSRQLGIAFDVHGCPNRCRHCYIGNLPSGAITEQEIRWAAGLFRRFVRRGQAESFFQTLKVSAAAREPDFSDDYRRLYELEEELSDGRPCRYELLSVWRLARDESYARWARQVGPHTCQITFFGLEATNDWFFRRKGAFADNLAATERLLEAGMKPRWQFFLTRKILPELGGLLRLVQRMRLRERVAALGGEFDVFLHTPSPDGRALDLEPLRPSIEELDDLPAEIVESSRRHFESETLFHTEADLCAEILAGEDEFPYVYPQPEMPWLLVTSRWEVFPINMGTTDPWWGLGSLRADPVGAVLERFEGNQTLGLRTIYGLSPKRLVRQYGDARSRRVYDGRSDLLCLYLARYCREHWPSGSAGP